MDQSFKKSQVDYIADTDRVCRFLENYENWEDQRGEKEYMRQLQEIANRTRHVLEVNLDSLSQFEDFHDISERIESNCRRYVSIFAAAADRLLPEPSEDVTPDIFDQIISTQAESKSNGNENADVSNLPPELTRRYQVCFVPKRDSKVFSVRTLKADSIGNLVQVKGIVTRVTDVSPLMRVATYTCEMCGNDLYQTVDSRSFTPLVKCASQHCIDNRTNGHLFLQTRGSKFEKFQELKLQELPEDVPIGHVPRGVSVYLRGDATRRCNPGDSITLTGIFLPTPQIGFRGHRTGGLTADTYIDAMSVISHKKSYSDFQLSDELLQEVLAKQEEMNVYSRLASSIAPEIYGMLDVKKALLLLLVGGVTKTFSDGMRIRGDLNVLLMGDPGVAKSQLLKHIATIAPRAVFSSGKGSSGVGLTAAVTRDAVTNEVVLEGGALVLADMGICCIDEFDKMEESDRTAIHEVMEQQTVSIAKAGITTTLNARASILAAANPVGGRYNPSKLPHKNIDLPVALLSRFDLLFVLVDQVDHEEDTRLAMHISTVHRTGEAPEPEEEVFRPEFLRAYIAHARTFQPYIPDDLMQYVTSTYVDMRANNTESSFGFDQARLRFANEVCRDDLEEAVRLTNAAKESAMVDKPRQANLGGLFELMRDYCVKRKTDTISMEEARRIGRSRNITDGKFEEELQKFSSFNTIIRKGNKIKLIL